MFLLDCFRKKNPSIKSLATPVEIEMENFKITDGYGKCQLKDGSFFTGNYKNGKPHGEGVYFFPQTEELFYGQTATSELNGKGIKITAHGERFEGVWSSGFLNGYGKITFLDKSKYEGQLILSEPTGWGTLNYNNGKIYEGEFNVDSDGWGSMNSEHVKYQGQWKQGSIHGFGILISSKIKYYGQLHQAEFHGWGTIVYENIKYQGQFQHGNFHGWGIVLNTEGTIYCGNWEHGRKSGFGIEIIQSLRIVNSGIWEDNKLINIIPLTYDIIQERNRKMSLENEKLTNGFIKLYPYYQKAVKNYQINSVKVKGLDRFFSNYICGKKRKDQITHKELPLLKSLPASISIEIGKFLFQPFASDLDKFFSNLIIKKNEENLV